GSDARGRAGETSASRNKAKSAFVQKRRDGWCLADGDDSKCQWAARSSFFAASRPLFTVALAVAARALPIGPDAAAAQYGVVDGALQEDQVDRQQQQPQRQHPDAQHGQEAENAAQDE